MNIKVIIIKIFLLTTVIINQSYSIENKYTFSGEFSYLDVLNAISEKSKRSILGSSEALKGVRVFEIDDKPFTVAIDHISKNLKEDGYDLFYDSSCIYVTKKLPEKEQKPIIYSVYMPYSKRYLVTEKKEDYLNAKQIDYEKHLSDSMSQIKKGRYFYKCELNIKGSSDEKGKEGYVKIESPFSTRINIAPSPGINISTGISAKVSKNDDRYDFDRTITIYCPDDTIMNLNFGSEYRRINAKIQTQQIVTESYESIFDGLTIQITPFFYKLKYRVGDTEINLTGIPDSTITGAATFASKSRGRSFLLPSQSEGLTTFKISAVLKTSSPIVLKERAVN